MTNSNPAAAVADSANPAKPAGALQVALLTLYYLAIVLMLAWMQIEGSFSTPKFIYQGF